jgi:acetylornithine/succinyldiaminopimelate/putrescine aminotransferase
MISATGNPAVKAGFEPMTPGFTQVEAGNFAALKDAVDDETAGILMEPIQGEGGINVYPPAYAAQVRQLCDEQKLTLIIDEVWTGGGRTGRWFGYQHFHSDDSIGPFLPDIMTLGKAVGGGLPVGVMFARPEIAKLLVPGKHGCTLGGNPICMSVARTIFDVIHQEDLVKHAAALGEHAKARLTADSTVSDKIAEVRGVGMFLGIELRAVPEKFVERALAKGIVSNVTAQKVIRIAPPLNISKDDFDLGLDRLIETIAAG